jgi:hypothetical protein
MLRYGDGGFSSAESVLCGACGHLHQAADQPRGDWLGGAGRQEKDWGKRGESLVAMGVVWAGIELAHGPMPGKTPESA